MTTPVLYQLPPVFSLFSLSPFCAKVQLGLRLKQIPYEVKNTLFADKVNPRGKLPYLVWGDRKLEDSTAILEAIDAEGSGPKLIPSDPKLAAEADLLEDWADESLYWQGVYAKFAEEAQWKKLLPEFRAQFPAMLRPVGPLVARRQTLAKLAAQGLTRRAPALVRREFSRHLDSLEVRLDGRQWLVGDAISIADVAVTAMLWQLLPQYAPWHAAEVAARRRLTALIASVRTAANA
ncbi:MAG: Glutathione S-transferase domain protein [Myxococcaceae bacterium]|nr:Glutathione S-transferase domain protein [Myxococcaceae bacterium]